MVSWLSRSCSPQHIRLWNLEPLLCVLRPSAYKGPNCVTATLTPISAGQLGRKLREWRVYKYDSKSRLSSPMWPVLDGSRIPQSVPVRLIDTDLQDPPPEDVPATDVFAPAPQVEQGNLISNLHSKLLLNYQTPESTYTEPDVSWCVINSKSKTASIQSCRWHQLTRCHNSLAEL
jgi:hypothetical protein